MVTFAFARAASLSGLADIESLFFSPFSLDQISFPRRRRYLIDLTLSFLGAFASSGPTFPLPQL